MTTPRYYRRAWREALVSMAVAFVLAVALWIAGSRTVAAIRQDERAKLHREGDALLQQSLAHARTLRRERDSLAAVVARVDTVLVTRIRRVRDTAWLPADTTPVVVLAACRVELDQLATACESFRVAATTALATADTLSRRDSAVIAGLTRRLAATRRADSATIATLSRRPRWRTLVGAVVGTAALTTLLRD